MRLNSRGCDQRKQDTNGRPLTRLIISLEASRRDIESYEKQGNIVIRFALKPQTLNQEEIEVISLDDIISRRNGFFFFLIRRIGHALLAITRRVSWRFDSRTFSHASAPASGERRKFAARRYYRRKDRSRSLFRRRKLGVSSRLYARIKVADNVLLPNLHSLSPPLPFRSLIPRPQLFNAVGRRPKRI